MSDILQKLTVIMTTKWWMKEMGVTVSNTSQFKIKNIRVGLPVLENFDYNVGSNRHRERITENTKINENENLCNCDLE